MIRTALSRLTQSLRRKRQVTNPITRSRTRLNLDPLEPRIVLTGPAFDYVINHPDALGSIVQITSSFGTAFAVADHLTSNGAGVVAHFAAPPDPDSGIGGQGYWDAQVALPGGFGKLYEYDPVLNLDGVIYNAITFVRLLRPEMEADVSCPDPNNPDLLPESAEGNDVVQPTPEVESDAGVRYDDGSVVHNETDLLSNAFDTPWGQTRSWSGGQGFDFGQHNGAGWVNPMLPVLRQYDDSTMYVTGTGKQVGFLKAAYSG